MKIFISTLSACLSLMMAYLPAVSVTSPLVVLDDNNNKVAVWQQTDTTNNNQVIVAANYIDGTGWGTPVVLSNKSFSVASPQLAVDSNGNCSCVWIALGVTSEASHTLYGAQFTTTSDLADVTASLISQSNISVALFSLTQILDDMTTIVEVVYTGETSTGAYAVYAVTGNGSTWTSEGQISSTVTDAAKGAAKRAQMKGKAFPAAKKGK